MSGLPPPIDYRDLLDQERNRLKQELLAIDDVSMAPSLSRGHRTAEIRKLLDAIERHR